MDYDADAIVVGTGPSGVSVALPLVEAGLRVILLDGGAERPAGMLPSAAYHDARRGDRRQWLAFLGRDLEALSPVGPPSPKFDAPGARFAFAGGAAAQRVEGRGLAAVVSLARGGLSGIWGAGIATYSAEELAEFPLSLADLAASYRRVAQRIGVTGFSADDLASELDAEMPSLPPLRMAENARRILAAYEKRRSAVRALGLRLGRPRVAVLTEPRAGRGACAYCDLCIWGCEEQSVWSAAHDLPGLVARRNTDYRPGTLVETIAPRSGGGWCVRAPAMTLAAPILVLAAGALVTARLVLSMQGRFEEAVPMRGAPGVGFALCLPSRIGAAISTREFSMGQISFTADGDPGRAGDAAYGTLFPASGVPASLVIERMPLARPAAVRVFRRLQPAMLLGNCFLPGRYSRSVARLVRDASGASRLVVEGAVSEDLPERTARLARQLRRGFRRLGALLVPGSFTSIGPGEDLRYSGSFPMSANSGPGQTDVFGQLHGAPGLHLVDLSVFPAMPAKHHTLTLMANADRIGHALAARGT